MARDPSSLDHEDIFFGLSKLVGLGWKLTVRMLGSNYDVELEKPGSYKATALEHDLADALAEVVCDAEESKW